MNSKFKTRFEVTRSTMKDREVTRSMGDLACVSKLSLLFPRLISANYFRHRRMPELQQHLCDRL